MPWWGFWRRPSEKDLDEELAHDLALDVEERIGDGMTPDEAERAARRDFGNLLSIRDRAREAWSWTAVERFWQDLIYGLRAMRRAPTATAVIVVTLMLGIGANTIVFSVIHAVLLTPLPYQHSERLVFVTGQVTRLAPIDFVDAVEVREWRALDTSLDSMAALLAARAQVAIGSEEVDLGIAHVVDAVTRTLGVSPAQGRDFLPEDVRSVTGSPVRRVALISDALAGRHFGGAPASLGKMLTINKVPYVVVGVLPAGLRMLLPGFDRSLTAVDVVVTDEENTATGQGAWVLGRLKPGASLESARAELETLHAAFGRSHPARPRTQVRMIPLQEGIVGNSRLALLMLWAAVGFVLLVACVNVANLLLTRSAARAREIAVRASLGATRDRLIRQLLTESVALALIGGLAGLALASWGLPVLVNISERMIDIPRLSEARINWSVLSFCLAACAITGVLSGLAPALSGSRRDAGELLRTGTGRLHAGRPHRLPGVLVVAEFALTLALLNETGLMLKSLLAIDAQTSVFAPELVLTASINARDVAQPDVYLGNLANRIEALPGVRAAAAYTNAARTLRIAGLPAPPPDQAVMMAIIRVTPHYFRAAGLRVVSGEWLSEDERQGTGRVTVVNDTVAKTVSALYPNIGPILGKKIDLGGKPADNPTIVGVVKSIQWRPDAEPEPQIFVPYAWWPLNGVARYLVRTDSDPIALAGPLVRIVKETPGVRMGHPETAEEALSSAIAPRRVQTALLVAFGGLALLLAVVGVYGVLSYAVAERTHEIGVRVALGAVQREILVMVLGRAVRLAALGIAFGAPLSAAFAGLTQNLLYGVASTDPATYLAVCAVLVCVATLAAYLPARRAASVNSVLALRYE
jgi:predicted permease